MDIASTKPAIADRQPAVLLENKVISFSFVLHRGWTNPPACGTHAEDSHLASDIPCFELIVIGVFVPTLILLEPDAEARRDYDGRGAPITECL
jgi:hypothetical protein